MTTIDTSPDSVPSSGVASGVHTESGLAVTAAWLTSSDHKRIGRLFIGGSLLGLLATAVVGILLGVERTDSGNAVFASHGIGALFQGLQTGLVFGVMLPLGLGLAVAVVPLQLGARALAFPRVALAGFYGWLAGIVLIVVALSNDGALGGADPNMVRLNLLGHGLVAVSLAATAGAIATSVLTTRAPGMTMRRVPMFAWSALVASIGLLLAMPVLVGAVIYLSVDLRHATAVFGSGGDVAVWVAWAFMLPTVALFAVPALGVFAELVPVSFRRRQVGRGVVFAGLALVAVGAFAGVTQQGVFNLPWAGSGVNLDDLGTKVSDLIPFALFNLLPLLGVVIVLLMALLMAKPQRGSSTRPLLTPALLLALFGLGMVFMGVAGNVLYAIDDLALQGTVFAEGALVYVAYGSVLGAFGGIAWWAPKLWGRRFPDAMLYPVVLLGLVGTVLASLPYYIAGFADQPAGAAVFSYSGPESTWNLLVLIGHALMALTVAAFAAAAVSAFTGDGEPAGDDPWDAHTVEWATTSPAPGNNFPEVPIVTSSEPLLDLKTEHIDGSQS